MKTSTIIVVLACIMVILYAIASFALQYLTGIEPSPTLTTSWHAFWGVELAALATIKTSKVIRDKKDEENK